MPTVNVVVRVRFKDYGLNSVCKFFCSLLFCNSLIRDLLLRIVWVIWTFEVDRLYLTCDELRLTEVLESRFAGITFVFTSDVETFLFGLWTLFWVTKNDDLFYSFVVAPSLWLRFLLSWLLCWEGLLVNDSSRSTWLKGVKLGMEQVGCSKFF